MRTMKWTSQCSCSFARRPRHKQLRWTLLGKEVSTGQMKNGCREGSGKQCLYILKNNRTIGVIFKSAPRTWSNQKPKNHDRFFSFIRQRQDQLKHSHCFSNSQWFFCIGARECLLLGMHKIFAQVWSCFSQITHKRKVLMLRLKRTIVSKSRCLLVYYLSIVKSQYQINLCGGSTPAIFHVQTEFKMATYCCASSSMLACPSRWRTANGGVRDKLLTLAWKVKNVRKLGS